MPTLYCRLKSEDPYNVLNALASYTMTTVLYYYSISISIFITEYYTLYYTLYHTLYYYSSTIQYLGILLYSFVLYCCQ
jgi:hypothetical protein